MEKTEKQHPLILIFYLDRIMMQQPHILKPFSDFVNERIAEREANMMAFFMPTDTNERIECINPIVATDEQKVKIDKLIGELSSEFNIGGDLNEDYDDGNIINTSDL